MITFADRPFRDSDSFVSFVPVPKASPIVVEGTVETARRGAHRPRQRSTYARVVNPALGAFSHLRLTRHPGLDIVSYFMLGATLTAFALLTISIVVSVATTH